MKVLKETLIMFKAMVTVFVWIPIKRAAKSAWETLFGPCCDDPKLDFIWTSGASIQKCKNCNTVRVHHLDGGW